MTRNRYRTMTILGRSTPMLRDRAAALKEARARARWPKPIPSHTRVIFTRIDDAGRSER